MLDKIWFHNHPAKWLLAPLSLLFLVLSSLRRVLFRLGVKSQQHPGVPVVVVGNISVGGNGKTPVVIAAVEWLIQAGYKPGVLSRGYGGSCQRFPHIVNAGDAASVVGDEPRLMASRLPCAVVIDPKRTRGAQALVAQGCNVIICDDGLQHYALKRDIEWVVMDDRKVGNGCLLPMGPLRELPSRLNNIDALIHNGSAPYAPHANNARVMTLRPGKVKNVQRPELEISLDELSTRYANDLTAMAGIGNPQRFFDSLQALNISLSATFSFSDHHQFIADDIPSTPVIMTEKDAVKCAAIAHKDCWYLTVDAKLPDDLRQQFLEKIHRITSNCTDTAQ